MDGSTPVLDWHPRREDKRAYTVLAKEKLDDPEDWEPVDKNSIPADMRFFKVKVKMR